MIWRLLLLLLVSCQAAAQGFPSRPIRVIVGYPPGGSGDFLTRLIADEMQKALGSAVIAENKPGAGGNIAAEYVAKAPADGYTVLNGGHHAINMTLYASVNYREEDFVPITKIATGPTVMVVRNDSPFASVRQLIDYAKANPGKLFNASAGYGSAPQLAAVVFEQVSGAKFTQVQFKGGGPAIQSVLSGDTQIAFSTAPTVMGLIRSGRLRALAVTKRDGSPSVPDVPGTAAVGLPDYEFTFWFGLYVPAGTPREVVEKLYNAAAPALRKPEVRDKVALQGMDPTPSTSPQGFAAEIRAEEPGIVSMVRASGAKVE